jgi:hypothetical protein
MAKFFEEYKAGKHRPHKPHKRNESYNDFIYSVRKVWGIIGTIAVVAIVLSIFALPYFLTNSEIYDMCEPKIKEAIIDDTGGDYDDLVLKDKSIKKVDTEFYRQNLGYVSTMEVTLVYSLNGKNYTGTALVERTDGTGPFPGDWEFYEVESVK